MAMTTKALSERLSRNRFLVIGRVGMDFFTDGPDTRAESAPSFQTGMGGSSANIAAGLCKLGSEAALVTCVSDDAVGRYCLNQLDHYGVARDHVRTIGGEPRTSLAVYETRLEDHQTVIYRNNAADLSLAPEDINTDMIASARLLIVSGTALCQSPSREAVYAALLAAEQSGTTVLLDLDYRAYNWRNLADARACYRLATRFATLVVGNREEFDVLGAPVEQGDDAIAKSLLDAPGATRVVFVKAGAEGSRVYCDDDAPIEQAVFSVQAKKPFGAGDAYAGAICAGLLQGLPMQECVKRGSAAAAIVVAGVSCSDASPTESELSSFMSQHS